MNKITSGAELDHLGRNWHQQIRAFCHVARWGSITAAAGRLGTTQPTISRLVRALEEEYSIVLFERSGPNVTLSPIGERLFRIALPLVERTDRLLDAFVEERRDVPSGALNIAAGQASAVAALPKYLKRFQERHPDLRISVRTGDGRQRLRWLRYHEVDIIFGSVDIPDSDTEFHPIHTSDIVLIIPEDHPLAGRESVTIEEMVRWPIVAHPLGTYSRDFGEMIGRLHGVSTDVDVATEDSGWLAIVQNVEAGLGVAMVPDVCLNERNRVWRIPFSRYFPSRTYGLTIRRNDILPLAARHFMELIESADPGPPAGSSGDSAAAEADASG